jgi:hypothetical protein
MSTNNSSENLRERVKKDLESLPPWARILLSLLLVGLIIKYTPLLDLFILCFYIVLVPLGFLVLVGVISTDLFNMIFSKTNEISSALKEEIKKAHKEAGVETPSETSDMEEAVQEMAQKVEEK